MGETCRPLGRRQKIRADVLAGWRWRQHWFPDGVSEIYAFYRVPYCCQSIRFATLVSAVPIRYCTDLSHITITNFAVIATMKRNFLCCNGNCFRVTLNFVAWCLCDSRKIQKQNSRRKIFLMSLRNNAACQRNRLTVGLTLRIRLQVRCDELELDAE